MASDYYFRKKWLEEWNSYTQYLVGIKPLIIADVAKFILELYLVDSLHRNQPTRRLDILPRLQPWDSHIGILWSTGRPVLVGRFSPLICRTGVPKAVPSSRYSYSVTDSELPSLAYFPPRSGHY